MLLPAFKPVFVIKVSMPPSAKTEEEKAGRNKCYRYKYAGYFCKPCKYCTF